MKKNNLIAILFILSGCTNKGIYEQIQTDNRIDCGKLPSPQYEECVDRNSKRYDEYERERQEALNK